MTLRDRVRNWLGINDIRYDLSVMDAAIARDLSGIRSNINTIAPGLGRVIAKLDANYAVSEHDPAKRDASDAIGDEVIRRLQTEAAAREPYNHE